jgi:dihydroorotate dehydrogenase electron transfer subunit
MPDLPTAFTITGIRDESPTVRTFVLDRALAAEPGQFVMVWLPGVNEKPFSLMDAFPVTLAIARVGPFTEAIHRLQVGGRLWLRGPSGRGFEPMPRPALLVSGGYGAAPLAFLARYLRESGQPVTAVLGAKTARDAILSGRFASNGCQVEVVTEDGTLGTCGLATDVAARLMRQERKKIAVYACGPEPMLEKLAQMCYNLGIAGQFSMERLMKCGFGVCGSCHWKGLLVCKDGPVFAADQLLHP